MTGHMRTPDQLAFASKLVRDLQLSTPRPQRLSGVTLPLSAIVAVVRTSLEGDPFFPPNARPELLGDGVVIERRGKYLFLVHERFELGQLRYSAVSSRRYFFLRSAIIRYLQHYGSMLKVDNVSIQWRS